MTDTPDKYLEKHKEEMPEKWFEPLKKFSKKSKLDIADRTLYDYLSKMKNISEKFVPDGFDPANPTQEEIREIATGIKRCDLSNDTKHSYYKTLKKFYKVYNNGEHYELTDCFKVSGSTKGVEKHMILSPKEVDGIINQAQNVRDKAFFRLLYECAVTPGELLQNKIKDVDLEEETIYIRGNKNHRSQTMELHNKGLSYLREYLRSHPDVDDIFSTNSDTELWVKIRNLHCRNCGKRESEHEENGCNNYEPEADSVGYRSFYKSFKRAVKNSSIDKNVKMKYLRKSMLTRLCSKGIGYEQLNNFARWQPGSNQAAHYVSISNDKLRNWVKNEFKGEGKSGKEVIECHNCGARNPADRVECKKCHRPLNVPESEKMRKASEIADKLAEFDENRLRKIENNLNLLENPEEMIEKKIEEKLKG